MMGAESVAYHRETIIERGDDFPGAAARLLRLSGRDPARVGRLAAPHRSGSSGAVDNALLRRGLRPGRGQDPASGERLVSAKRPGMELVIAAHKSVAELGVLGRAEDMHAIMDAERDATLGYLDDR